MTALSWSFITVAFGSVLLAELAGDKTLYVVSSLATKFRPIPVLVGIGSAAAIKMLAAVLLGRVIAHVAGSVTGTLSMVTFLWAAYVVWSEPVGEAKGPETSARDGMKAGFFAIIGTEWGDPGQLAAAALAINTHAAPSVWVGATAAMITKSIIALTVGAGIRRVVPAWIIRSVACGVCLTMAIVTAVTTSW